MSVAQLQQLSVMQLALEEICDGIMAVSDVQRVVKNYQESTKTSLDEVVDCEIRKKKVRMSAHGMIEWEAEEVSTVWSEVTVMSIRSYFFRCCVFCAKFNALLVGFVSCWPPQSFHITDRVGSDYK